MDAADTLLPKIEVKKANICSVVFEVCSIDPALEKSSLPCTVDGVKGEVNGGKE